MHDPTPIFVILSSPDTPEVVLEPVFKVDGRGVDSAWLAEELERRVAERRRSGLLGAEVEAALADRLPEGDDTQALPPIQELDYSATRARQTWEVTPAYPIATEKKLFRPLVIFAKRLARLWARIAVGPIQRDQSAYNRHVASALDAVRRQALSERAEARAAEEDLCLLAEAMVGEAEGGRLASLCVGALGEVGRLTVLCPCPRGLLESLAGGGLVVSPVLCGSAWEEPAGPFRKADGPFSFLSEVAEGGLEALLVPELAFWLRPEKLIGLARAAYLSLARGGALIIAVHGFASSAPAPAWCDHAVVERALEIAGFTGITALGLSREPEAGARPDGYVVLARK